MARLIERVIWRMSSALFFEKLALIRSGSRDAGLKQKDHVKGDDDRFQKDTHERACGTAQDSLRKFARERVAGWRRWLRAFLDRGILEILA